MTDADKQLHTEETMRQIASGLNQAIKENIGENLGFIFILFEFGKPGISNYISNAERDDVIVGLREAADKLEQKLDVPRAHGTVQ